MNLSRHMKPKVVVIVGPTASGKTALSIELARRFDGEVISADSRQVYRGLDIGTGKVTRREMRGVPHHLLDVVSPKKVFTADDFVKKGRRAINDLLSRQKLPVVAGGTGFYIDALLGTISLPNVPPNKQLRNELASLSLEELNERLEKLDPERAADIDQKNPVRLIRAIEIATVLGKNPPPQTESLYDVLWIGIDVSKEVLHEKIENRLRARMKRGMLSEAKRLHAEGLSWNRMEELGLEYRYMARLLQKQITRKEFYTELTSEIKQYAKRQMTYWKRNKEIRWVKPVDAEEVFEVVREFLGR